MRPTDAKQCPSFARIQKTHQYRQKVRPTLAWIENNQEKTECFRGTGSANGQIFDVSVHYSGDGGYVLKRHYSGASICPKTSDSVQRCETAWDVIRHLPSARIATAFVSRVLEWRMEGRVNDLLVQIYRSGAKELKEIDQRLKANAFAELPSIWEITMSLPSVVATVGELNDFGGNSDGKRAGTLFAQKANLWRKTRKLRNILSDRDTHLEAVSMYKSKEASRRIERAIYAELRPHIICAMADLVEQ